MLERNEKNHKINKWTVLPPSETIVIALCYLKINDNPNLCDFLLSASARSLVPRKFGRFLLQLFLVLLVGVAFSSHCCEIGTMIPWAGEKNSHCRDRRVMEEGRE